MSKLLLFGVSILSRLPSAKQIGKNKGNLHIKSSVTLYSFSTISLSCYVQTLFFENARLLKHRSIYQPTDRRLPTKENYATWRPVVWYSMDLFIISYLLQSKSATMKVFLKHLLYLFLPSSLICYLFYFLSLLKTNVLEK